MVFSKDRQASEVDNLGADGSVRDEDIAQPAVEMMHARAAAAASPSNRVFTIQNPQWSSEISPHIYGNDSQLAVVLDVRDASQCCNSLLQHWEGATTSSSSTNLGTRTPGSGTQPPPSKMAGPVTYSPTTSRRNSTNLPGRRSPTSKRPCRRRARTLPSSLSRPLRLRLRGHDGQTE